MIRVAVVDDHQLLRETLIKMLDADPGFEVVAEAGRGADALAALPPAEPDVVLLDIAMPDMDGLEVAKRLRAQVPDIRIVFLTMHDEDGSLRRAMSLRADGFVPKTASSDEVIQALQTVAEGGTYLSPAVARRVMDLASGKGSGAATTLTERELEILKLLSTGARPQEMADQLFLSVKTVKNHLTNVYSKLGVETAAQAVAEAFRLGLAHPGEVGGPGVG